ncbi:MAG: exodeoxyribonuclease VII large subunit [Tissierellales bacterium]|nr:exodeoxyribonuclease VII large subunit [Tissierellales bacterium]
MKPLRVSEVNNYIKKIFASDILLPEVSIVGEISNLSIHYSSGHIYFNLKDENSKLKCVMFKTYAQTNDIELKDGLKIVAIGNISVYEKDGIYQLYVRKIKKDGIGELYLIFEELKNRLQKEGLFESIHKKPISKYPQKIGIVTSPTGAAIRDIIRIMKRRFPPINVVIYPSQVQGEKAVDQLIEGLNYLDKIDDIDLIILTRGGGSIDELFVFNDERLAREIFSTKKPVISAVGHETDFTISDFVADFRAATPSEAAELATPEINALRREIFELKNSLIKLTFNILERCRIDLEQIQKYLNFYNPKYLIEERRIELDNIIQVITFKMFKKIDETKNRLERQKIKLDLHNPTYVLDQGYAYITDDNGIILTDINSVNIGMNVILNLKNGEIDAEIKSISTRGNIREK